MLGRRGLWVALVASMLIGILVGVPATAQESTPSDDEVNAIAKELYCPVCENVPLDVCGTAACEQWRQVIRDKLSEGWSEEQIKTYFIAQYGDRVSATPPPSGFNWLVYVLPPLAFLVGAVVLIRVFRSWRKPDQTPKVEEGALAEDPYVSRLEEELRQLDE